MFTKGQRRMGRREKAGVSRRPCSEPSVIFTLEYKPRVFHTSPQHRQPDLLPDDIIKSDLPALPLNYTYFEITKEEQS